MNCFFFFLRNEQGVNERKDAVSIERSVRMECTKRHPFQQTICKSKQLNSIHISRNFSIANTFRPNEKKKPVYKENKPKLLDIVKMLVSKTPNENNEIFVRGKSGSYKQIWSQLFATV